MSLLPSVATRITVEATRYRSAVSEFLVQTLGKSINYLLDDNDAIQAALAATSISVVTFEQVLQGDTGIRTVPANTTAFVIGVGTSYTLPGRLVINGIPGSYEVMRGDPVLPEVLARIYPAGTTIRIDTGGGVSSMNYWIIYSKDANIVI